MPNTELDLEELDLDTDLNEFDEKDKKPLDSNKDSKMPCIFELSLIKKGKHSNYYLHFSFFLLHFSISST